MVSLLLLLPLAAHAGDDPSAPADPAPAALAPAPVPAAPTPKLFEVSGMYAIWALHQQNFLLGAPDPTDPDRDKSLDDADYIVQMLRVSAKMQREHYGVATRLDLAQGWWGVDNEPNTSTGTSTDAAGTTTYNGDKLFGSKDTNYSVHVDLAYAWVDLLHERLRVEGGRMEYKLGHLLVLDTDLDGVRAHVQPASALGVELGWGKVSEGLGSYLAPTGSLMNDVDPFRDADLFTGAVRLSGKPGSIDLFGVYYQDHTAIDPTTGDPTGAYLPDGLGYAEARFRPQVRQAVALGLSGDATVGVADGLTVGAEVDYLFGRDDVDNADTAGGKLDVNDGALRGWNAWLTASQAVTAGVPLRFGVSFGMGSGDPDVTSGAGNLNRIQTQGFFHLTNVWEDSVMPDIEGISPQGLGSPVTRGYRELENTTIVQARVGAKPHPKLDLEAEYSFLRSTVPVTGWDGTGVPTADSASDLGQEIDLDLTLAVWKGFGYRVESGVFLPGAAAGLLINGTAAALDPAWEIKQVVSAKF